MGRMEAWINKQVKFLVHQCDMRLSEALTEAKKIWNEAQFKFFIDDNCVTHDGFKVIVTDMCYEDGVAYYICKPTEFNCSIERSFTAEQLTLEQVVLDRQNKQFWCCDVRKFDSNRIKTIVYPVYAQCLPENDVVPNKLCEQKRFFCITYAEAKQLKAGYDCVDEMIAKECGRK